ncbi:DDE-type integrase/transposase/recombinase [Plantactinospora solaniradicis]|uniref:DDE-type integrase/transposase/recombinase n=1 Tax=Plantactinospora solaniradicis TaxID=1723736 RepID=A0ABW1KRG2_9ACTN
MAWRRTKPHVTAPKSTLRAPQVRLPAVDQHGQVIDVLVSARRDAAAARRFFQPALRVPKVTPSEVATDAAPVYPAVLDDLISSAWHHVERYANNPIEADHSHLKHRLRPMRGLRTDLTAQTIIAGHAFMRNLRRGHYELRRGRPPGNGDRRRVHRTHHSDLIPSPRSVPPTQGTGSATAPPDVIFGRYNPTPRRL